MVFMDPKNLPQPTELEAALKNLHSRFHEVREFRRMLDYGSHRGCALAAAAFLDERLKQLLSALFVPGCVEGLLDGATAPLGTLSARILTAQALGLLPPKAARDLHLIRKIRNEFAHS
jgi:DNA-binding MltR family transcriptional regulator